MGELRHIATSARKRKWLVLIEIIRRTLNFRLRWIGVKQIFFPLPLPSATSTLSKTIPRHVFIHSLSPIRIHCFSISSEPQLIREGQYWVNAGNEKANSCGMNAQRTITITLQDYQLRGTYGSSRIIMKNASVFLQDGQLHGTYVSGRIIMKNASTVQKFSPDRAKKQGSGNFIALQWGFFPLFWSNWSLVSLFVATMSRLLLWFGWRSIPLLALLFFFGCKPLNLKPTCF